MTKPTPEAKRAATPQFNFNRRSLAAAIKKHPATAGQRYLRDAGTRGLVLELTPAGNAAFQAYFKHLGRPKRVTLGRFDPLLPDARQLPDAATQDPLSFIAARPDLSVTMARDLAATVRAAIAAGASPTRHAAALRADPTVGDLLDEYVMHLEQGGKRRNSAESARAALAHLTPLRHTRATDLVRGEVAALHKRVGKQFPTMANRAVLDTLRAAFNLALKNGRIAHRDNPATRIDRFAETQRERFLSSAELALLRRAYANERQDFRDLFELLLATGARKSAVLLMRHADVDLDRAEWRVPAEHSKSGQPYSVPLMPAGAATLKRLRTNSSGVRVFSFAAASLDRAWQRTFAEMKRLRLLDALHLPETSPKSIAELTDEAVRRRLPPTDYAVEHCTIHDLRRTTGSHAAIAGVGLHLVGAMLGHTSQRATKVYARLSQDALRDAAKLANATLAAPAPKAPVLPFKRGRA